MDWDDVRTPAAKAVVVGEPLDALAVAELQARVIALEGEISRVRAEIEKKRSHAAAADQFFRP